MLTNNSMTTPPVAEPADAAEIATDPQHPNQVENTKEIRWGSVSADPQQELPRAPISSLRLRRSYLMGPSEQAGSAGDAPPQIICSARQS
jgi:hypothetical protein